MALAFPWVNLCLIGVLLIIGSGFASAETICPINQGYPEYCPQPGYASDFTKCCRQGYAPACCQERQTQICAKTSTGKMTGVYNPNWNLVFCPQPGQPDSYTACCYKGSSVYCCDKKLLIAILAGAFGSIAVVGLIVGITLCFVCRYKIRKGDWVCLQIRPGKYKVVTRKTYEQIQAQQRAMGVQAPPSEPPPAYSSQYDTQYNSQYNNTAYTGDPSGAP